MRAIPESHPLRRWFAGLVEASFQREIGLCDPTVLAYLVELLTDFIHTERINTMADGSGRRVEDMVEILVEAEAGPETGSDERRRMYHRHIGDYTLFWTGVYPEILQRMKRRPSCDNLLSYSQQGKRSYGIASELSDDGMQPPASVLRTLSEQFEYCVYGLGLVRKSWEQADPEGLGGATLLWR